MAGDWMKVELDLPDKPEVHHIASILNLDPDSVVGKLVRVWSWFDKHTENGNAFGVTYAFIDRMTGVTGFAEAMSFAGWLEQDSHNLIIPDFTKHNGKTAKKRALTAKRVNQHKQKSNANGNAGGVKDALPREEKIYIPDGIDNAAWMEFEKFRAGMPKQKQLTDKAREIAWKLLLKHPPEIQKEIIENSIMNGWTGLFEPKPGGSNAKTQHPRDTRTPLEKWQAKYDAGELG